MSELKKIDLFLCPTRDFEGGPAFIWGWLDYSMKQIKMFKTKAHLFLW